MKPHGITQSTVPIPPQASFGDLYAPPKKKYPQTQAPQSLPSAQTQHTVTISIHKANKQIEPCPFSSNNHDLERVTPALAPSLTIHGARRKAIQLQEYELQQKQIEKAMQCDAPTCCYQRVSCARQKNRKCQTLLNKKKLKNGIQKDASAIGCRTPRWTQIYQMPN